MRGDLQLRSNCTFYLYVPARIGGRTGVLPIRLYLIKGDVMVGKDGRAIARANEFRILRSLQRFGWLRTRDLAQLGWTRWPSKPIEPFKLANSPTRASSLRMAQRTLRRLRLMRNVISSQAPDGSIVYTLSEAGARALKNSGIDSVSGKDLVRSFSASYFRHRCISNEIAIAGITQGFRVSTEREIAQGRWLGGEAGVLGKRPDVVIRDDKRAIFVEVEKSRKKKTEYQALIRWLCALLQRQSGGGSLSDLLSGIRLEKVVFVCTTSFQTKLQNDLNAVGWSKNQQNTLISYSCELYHFTDILFP